MKRMLVLLVCCLLPLAVIAEETPTSGTIMLTTVEDGRPQEWELKYLEARNQILQLQAELFQGAAQKEFDANLRRIEELKKKSNKEGL